MISAEALTNARSRILAEFLRAVKGPPTKVVQSVDSEAAALGQHLRGSRPQRGLHGTAAAIQVLSSGHTEETQLLTRRLVHYIDERFEIEQSITAAGKSVDSLQISDNNVIKLSEVLYALAGVPTSVAPREQIAKRIAEVLRSARRTDGGWPYYVEEGSDESELLPTAYAVRALVAHGYNVGESTEYLRERLKNPGESQTDISVQVTALYVLCFLPDSEVPSSELRAAFSSLWLRLAPLLSQDLEANIEYWGGRMSYIRVPWQLYMLAIAAKLSPYRRFASSIAQRRLKAILAGVDANGGLIYPHSGRDLSSRTNAILFEVLGIVREQLNIRRLPLGPFEIYEEIKKGISSRTARYIIRAAALGLIVFAVVSWLGERDHHIGEFAPEIIGSVLLILLTGKREV